MSGGVRGASWEGLGRSWGDLGATFKAVRFRIDFLIDFERKKGTKREAFREPKSIPKRFKIEIDFQERKHTLQDRLGTVLEPSWVDLGPS